jgi:[CysO sulfur-carrier protein]-thiocarboxylate-dependent cysteine synthase
MALSVAPGTSAAFEDIVAAIGHTPMVGVPRLSPDPAVKLFVKLEGANPTGSVKDRVARALIEDLQARGRLRPGSILLEATSGNTGISLAMLGHRLGHRVTLVMPDNVTQERREVVRLFGAEIIESPGALGSNGAVAMARELAAGDRRYVMADQYANAANPRAHETTTGPEILAACPEIDAFVAGLGTGGTLMGVGRFLRRERPNVRLIAAEPLPGELVQGLRSLDDGFVPEIFDPAVLDARQLVSNREAIEAARQLVKVEGIFAGPSSGAVLVVAQRIARELLETRGAGTVVALLADGGWKYLSAGAYAGDLDAMEDALEGAVSWW